MESPDDFLATADLTANIRTIQDEHGEPWFVAKDVCAALGLSNVTVAVADIAATDKAKFNLGLPGSAPTLVNESGLYALIVRSNKPSAKRFRKWVTSEVLPSILKNGKCPVCGQRGR